MQKLSSMLQGGTSLVLNMVIYCSSWTSEMLLIAFAGTRCSTVSCLKPQPCFRLPIPLIVCHHFFFYGEFLISSAEGVQQGDPLGPLLFCLTIHELVTSLESEFKINVFFLDDGTLGGYIEDVQADLHLLEDHARDFNLFLNHDMSEIICNDETTRFSMFSLSPSLSVVEPSRATLLGAPIGDLSLFTKFE